MKKIHLLYLTLLAICISFGSCKDEEEMMICGKGGVLAGIWGLVDEDDVYIGEDNLQYGISISVDGKIQRVRFSGTMCEPFNDYVDGIIQLIARNAIKVLGQNGEGFAPIALDTIFKEKGNRLMPFMRLRLENQNDEKVDGISVFDSGSELDKAPFPIAGTYIKECRYDDFLDLIMKWKSLQLLGEWNQRFGTNSFSFTSVDGKINGNHFADWSTKNGVLYILTDGVISQHTYFFEGTELIIDGERFVKSGS
jgi:hypothetical protein